MSKKTNTIRKLKPDPKKAKAREAKLLDELCAKHGYLFQDAPKGQRITMTQNRATKRIDASYRIFLIVPSTSTLGEQFAARYKQLSAPKAKK